jgi:uncharacterized linocin/CFP29 family protein
MPTRIHLVLHIDPRQEFGMADEASQLPWTAQQWNDLRAAALDSARRSRVASTFLPLVGPLSSDQSTVPSDWMTTTSLESPQLGEARSRLQVRSGKTLHLVTISCNVYLRGAEVAESGLDSAKSMVRRAAEVLGRLEDAIVFHGRPEDGENPTMDDGRLVVQPPIYTITGGRDLTGLLQAPDTYFASRAKPGAQGNTPELQDLKRQLDDLAEQDKKIEDLRKAQGNVAQAESARKTAENKVKKAEDQLARDIMSVRVGSGPANRLQIVEAVVEAIQKLEEKGHFGPFAVVLGHELFSEATTPTSSLVLPSDRLAEFLDGRRVMRSGTLPSKEGVVVALGGESIELVLATDIDVVFLQVTLEPRYVLRIFERFVLRIKELDAVCRVKVGDGTLLTPGFVPRRAAS